MAVNLSDSELSERLQGLGVAVGPITSTTREVYCRKYRALLAQPAAPPLSKPCKGSASPKQVHAGKVSTTPPPATPPPVDSAPPPTHQGKSF